MKTFYKIVAVIVEAQSQYHKSRKDIEVCQGIPDVCIGVPFYDQSKIEERHNDEFSLRDAKFEVEIELENKEMENGTQSFSKIKVFQ